MYGVYKHTGGIQMYGVVQLYGCTDLGGHTDIWEDVWGA